MKKYKFGVIIGVILIISLVTGGIFALFKTSASLNAKAIAVAAQQSAADAKKVADAKTQADQKLISDKNNVDQKALEDQKIRIAQILADQKITQAEIIADAKTASDAKALLAAKAKANEVVYTNYNNSRYGFSIQYPNFLINKSSIDDLTSEQRSGYIFSSPDNLVTLKVEGWNNTGNDTLKTFCANFQEEENVSIPKSDIFLQKYGDNWFEESYTIHGNIVFQYVKVGPGSINAIKFEYPIAQKEKFVPVVQTLFDSFKTLQIDIQH